MRAAARLSPRLWIALLFVALLGACGKSVTLPRLGAGDVVLAFGDSLTFGTGVREEESYPAVLETLIGHRVVRAGFPGEVSEQGVERLPPLLEEHRPRLLLLCMGGNDMLQKVDPAVTEVNLKTMVRQARERGIAVVLIGVPQPALFGGVAEFYGKVARDLDVPVEDAVLKSVLYDKAYKSDPIHPNAAGYRRLAEALAALLRKAGAV